MTESELDSAAREYVDKQFELFQTEATEDAFKAGYLKAQELHEAETKMLVEALENISEVLPTESCDEMDWRFYAARDALEAYRASRSKESKV